MMSVQAAVETFYKTRSTFPEKKVWKMCNAKVTWPDILLYLIKIKINRTS